MKFSAVKAKVYSKVKRPTIHTCHTCYAIFVKPRKTDLKIPPSLITDFLKNCKNKSHNFHIFVNKLMFMLGSQDHVTFR